VAGCVRHVPCAGWQVGRCHDQPSCARLKAPRIACSVAAGHRCGILEARHGIGALGSRWQVARHQDHGPECQMIRSRTISCRIPQLCADCPVSTPWPGLRSYCSDHALRTGGTCPARPESSPKTPKLRLPESRTRQPLARMATATRRQTPKTMRQTRILSILTQDICVTARPRTCGVGCWL